MYDTFVKALMHSWVFFELSSPLQITNIFYVPTKVPFLPVIRSSEYILISGIKCSFDNLPYW